MTDLPATGLQMFTLAKEDGTVELSLANSPVASPQAHEVVVKVMATPINPSDLGLMLGAADSGSARLSSRDGLPAITCDVPAAVQRAMTARLGQSLPVGNEGCGVVVAAGESPEAQALLGKTVAMLGGALYAQYRTLPAMMCMELPDGTDPKDGASCFVNPLTALSFVETLRRDGFKALIHTAAASNLGQMLVKICAADGIPLINIVRSQAQVDMLKGIGAKYVVNSSADSFMADLVSAISETEAYLAFDAVGGGALAGQILTAMEVSAAKSMPAFSVYGSDTFKQVYIYGMLEVAPTTITRSFGFSWAISGFLLPPFLAKAGMEVMMKMRARVVAELHTTFASHYNHEISLEQALDVATLQDYRAMRTGDKYLIRPNG